MAKRRKRATEDDEQQEVVRQNYLLKNGTTVSVDDYDEDKHDIVEESDDEYTRRIESAPNARPAGTVHARTTIPNLHTFDSTQQQTPPTPVPPAPGIGGGIPDARPVMTADEPNTNLLDPNKRTASGALERPTVARPEDTTDEDDDDTEDKE